MKTCAKRLRIPVVSLFLAGCVLLPAHRSVKAGNPHGAYYSSDHDKIFWFLHVSDLHIGMSGDSDRARLQWLVTTARTLMNPSFVVATGDLTDSTNGNLFGYPNGPYQAEWNEYKGIVDGADAGPDFLYDLPGNHDAYNDKYFSYYLANSVQGRATLKTQLSWTRTFPFGTYHFLGVNTADNTGSGFSLFFPYGDRAGLDSTELAFIGQELSSHAGADLAMVFGHHPVTDTGESGDTWLFYGQEAFIQFLDNYAVSNYDYGHTHRNLQALFKGNGYTGLMRGDGIHYDNVASLAKDSPNSYNLVAIDCNGVSSISKEAGAWPVVLITAPVDRYIGTTVNPYAYTVPASSANPVRALVFDAGSIARVDYRIDGGATWYPMSPVSGSPALWEATWNASGLAAGDHTIEVQAQGTSTASDGITVQVVTTVNQPPVAAVDAYTTAYQTALTVAARGVLANDTDPDGNPMTAIQASGPAHGTLTLNANGSFTYTPAAGYSGVDSFTYKAFDGTAYSAAATVSITVKTQPDDITILSATWSSKLKRLTVEATSSAQPTAKLTVTGYGPMTFKSKTKTYLLQATAVTNPGTVTVTSNLGGSAKQNVTAK